MTQPIRVVVANRPRLMRELTLAAIVEHPDIELVAEIAKEDEIIPAVEVTQPDFLIIALTDANECPPLCKTLLLRFPEMKILAIAPERNAGIFYWASIQIQSKPAEVSEGGILRALRHKGQYI